MIKNPKGYEKFENDLIANEKVDYKKNLQIVDMLLEEARYLGVLPLKNPLENIEEKIKLARIINSVTKSFKELS